MTARAETAFGLLFAATFFAVASTGAGLVVIFSLPALSQFWLWMQVISAGVGGIVGAIFLATAYRGSISFSLLVRELADRADDCTRTEQVLRSLGNRDRSPNHGNDEYAEQLLLAKHRVGLGARMVDIAQNSLHSIASKLQHQRFSQADQHTQLGRILRPLRQLSHMQKHIQTKACDLAAAHQDVKTCLAEFGQVNRDAAKWLKAKADMTNSVSQQNSAAIAAADIALAEASDLEKEWRLVCTNVASLASQAVQAASALHQIHDIADRIHLLAINAHVDSVREIGVCEATSSNTTELGRLSAELHQAARKLDERIAPIQKLTALLQDNCDAKASRQNAFKSHVTVWRSQAKELQKLVAQMVKDLPVVPTFLTRAEAGLAVLNESYAAQTNIAIDLNDVVRDTVAACLKLQDKLTAQTLQAHQLLQSSLANQSSAEELETFFRAISRQLHAANNGSANPLPRPVVDPIPERKSDFLYANFVKRRLARIHTTREDSERLPLATSAPDTASVLIHDLRVKEEQAPQKEVI